MSTSKNIKKGMKLYRYDVVEPPKDGWNTSFKSPIYIWDYEGPKNEIGAFFLFDSEKEALDVAKNVIVQRNDFLKSFNPQLSVWLTETTTTEDIQMLDLAGCKDVVDMYVTLWNENINVFRTDFYKFDKVFGSKPLSILLEDIKYLALEDGKKEKNKVSTCKCNIENFYNTYEDKEKLSYACQELTDFSNGEIFKELLEKKGYEGYIFRETNANTFCLFHPNKLSKPQTIIISNI